MLSESDIILNRAAQGSITNDEFVSWFDSLSEPSKLDALERLRYFCFQSHPLPDEVDKAIEHSGIKPTMVPCVILKKNHINEALQKIVKLPGREQIKSLKVLISLLSIADGRRRATSCANGCSHEWHNLPE